MKIPLYAPDHQEMKRCPYETYHVEVRKKGFVTTQIQGIQIFAGEHSTLDVWMLPIQPDVKSKHTKILHTIQAHHQWITYHRSALTPPDLSSQRSISSHQKKLPFPSSITIHVSEFDQPSQDLRVPFVYYLKNTACSQCYPTWSHEILTSMIWAQIITLWNCLNNNSYRKQGHAYDVMDTDAYLPFEKHRNLFSSICRIVDDIAKEFFVIDDREDAVDLHIGSSGQNVLLLQEYLYGFLKQQGHPMKIPFSACFDEQTKVAVQLMQSQYQLPLDGAVDTRTWQTITQAYSAIDQFSFLNHPPYPGRIIQFQDHGEVVHRIQQALNTLSSRFPAIPVILQNDSFDEGTQAAVRTFQRIFQLPVNGIIDQNVWDSLFQKACEIEQGTSSNNEEPVFSHLQTGSSGNAVLSLQKRLHTISTFYSSIPAVPADGFFGEETLQAVIAFQRLLGLYADGILNLMTWNQIHQIYEELLLS